MVSTINPRSEVKLDLTSHTFSELT